MKWFLDNVLGNIIGETVLLVVSAVLGFLVFRYRRLMTAVGSGKQTPSPDGKQVAIENGDEIYAVGNGRVRNATHHPGQDNSPVWSQDSRYFAFQSNRGGDWNVWVYDTKTCRVSQLTTLRGKEQILRWDEKGNLHIEFGGSVFVILNSKIVESLEKA